jgi:hypothetical protein
VHAHAPPENGEGVLQQTPTPKLTGLPQSKARFAFRQACRHSATVTEQMPPEEALYAREILQEIRRLRVRQAPFGRVFWGLEQAIARLSDEIERLAS